ncbi:MAG: tRNA (5-methylaminomethyl-2-thiouridine)(34)-methyltransferase MnmD [Bacteroidales bacterium]|nr:tRNA (5-methylaminomethyl-2-thiouridine)(34)-methyltransferase MnmD [Bacteroidales bacterium]
MHPQTDNSNKPEISLIYTRDGSHTIYVPELDEHYHSVNGAVQESRHIFINYGFHFCTTAPLRIFEVGFGTGLNALLTAAEALKGTREIHYTSVEKFPLGRDILKQMNHGSYAGTDGRYLSELISGAPWGESHGICRNFTIRKINGDLATDNFEGTYDLVYFDAFGPDKQPEMWSPEIFIKIASMTVSGGILVTYSAKGQVRRNLRDAGFSTELLPGPPGKRHVMRAVKI